MIPEFYWIAREGPGRLAIMPRDGDWLEDELRGLRQAGVEVLVSLLTPAEVHELGLEAEEAAARDAGLAFLSFPPDDRGLPASPEQALAWVRQIQSALDAGQGVAVHCRIGIGRSALLTARVLVAGGMTADEALGRIAAARGLDTCRTPRRSASGSSASPACCERRRRGRARSARVAAAVRRRRGADPRTPKEQR
jgi:protein tyrosine phosphatase (PTP) superfamily phosphohydrolase (DUF442 family)